MTESISVLFRSFIIRSALFLIVDWRNYVEKRLIITWGGQVTRLFKA